MSDDCLSRMQSTNFDKYYDENLWGDTSHLSKSRVNPGSIYANNKSTTITERNNR